MTMAATEDRATRGRDPSADCGAETEGWAAHRRPSFQIPFGIGINAINPEAAQPPSPRAIDALSSLKKRISVSTIRGERQILFAFLITRSRPRSDKPSSIPKYSTDQRSCS